MCFQIQRWKAQFSDVDLWGRAVAWWELWLPGHWGRCWGGRHSWCLLGQQHVRVTGRVTPPDSMPRLTPEVSTAPGADLHSKPEFPQQGKNTPAGWTSAISATCLKAARCSGVPGSTKHLAALVVCQTLHLFQTSLHWEDGNLCQSTQHHTFLLMAGHLFTCKGRLNSQEIPSEIMAQHFGMWI